MQLIELTKRVSLQTLYRIGHYSKKELKEMQRDGWRIVWKEKGNVQFNKHGIQAV